MGHCQGFTEENQELTCEVGFTLESKDPSLAPGKGLASCQGVPGECNLSAFFPGYRQCVLLITNCLVFQYLIRTPARMAFIRMV